MFLRSKVKVSEWSIFVGERLLGAVNGDEPKRGIHRSCTERPKIVLRKLKQALSEIQSASQQKGRAMRVDGNFRAAYRHLEGRMKALAEADGDVFLQNPEPEGPAEYVFICMEPSLGRWARSAEEAKSKVDAGFRNFLSSMEDFILHFCIRRYLCESTQRYHITDFSKGAMLVKRAGLARIQRYDRWYAVLQEEINLVATSDAAIVAVGNVVFQHLMRRGFQRPFTQIIHYSGQAGRARSREIVGHEDGFEAFRGCVSIKDVVATAEAVLRETHVPTEMCDETLSRLSKSQLTTSRQQLIFSYKLAFESIRANRGVRAR